MLGKVDRRQGKRSLSLSSDHLSEEKREGFNFPVYLSSSENLKEEASPSPFSHLIMNTSNRSTLFPIPEGKISTSDHQFVEGQDPSKFILQGKLLTGSFPYSFHYLDSGSHEFVLFVFEIQK